jgi:hypothetical protein
MSDQLTMLGLVALAIAAIMVVLAVISAFQDSSDGFGDGLAWAFYLAMAGVVLVCCGGHLGILGG